MVASLAIPWGEVKDDQAGRGGYHLIWTRDMVHAAIALLAAGNTETPLRSVIYLACTQREDGGFAQKFWVDGESFWSGSQMDEVAFPILLAHRLWKEGRQLFLLSGEDQNRQGHFSKNTPIGWNGISKNGPLRTLANWFQVSRPTTFDFCQTGQEKKRPATRWKRLVCF